MEDPKDNLGAIVSLSEIYQEVKGLRLDVTQLITKAEINVSTALDHESRIRTLEKRVTMGLSIAILLSLAVAPVIEFILG